jgi:hypothetical protein
LAQDPQVAYISPDRPMRVMMDNSAATVNASVAWQSYSLDGSRVGIAVIDSGVSNLPDLQPGPTSSSSPSVQLSTLGCRLSTLFNFASQST